MALIRTVQKEELTSNRYHKFNYSRNPFPRKPGISINSSDDRENGSIYKPDLRSAETTSFEKIIVPQNNAETKNICFLMDYATRVGRGIGKTSFLNYQQKRINKDLGDEITQGSEVLIAVYCSPIPSENYRKFYSFSKLIIHSMIEQKIISMAACRMRVLTGLLDERIFTGVDDTNMVETIGNIEWIRQKYSDLNIGSVSEHSLNQEVKRLLEKKGIKNKLLADRFSRFGYNPNEFAKLFFSSLTDSDWRKEANSLLFDDLISIFELAEITKGIVLCDEIEKIIIPLNTQDRRSFCEELRYWFLDGDNKNASKSFYNILLVIHPYIQEILNPHWNAAGLERFAALGGQFAEEFTIFFKPIAIEQAIPLAIEYMKHSRLNGENDVIEPFDDEALEYALQKSYNVPGKFLALLHLAIEKAIDENWDTITKEKIEKILLTSNLNQNQIDSEDMENDGMSEPKIIL
jgi:hypothetical protein